MNADPASPHILVIHAHPSPHQSRANRKLVAAARSVAGVEVLDLYQQYPDFYIDVPAEQARLTAADVVVFMHPIQWYSAPSLLKEWVDAVLLRGWAYGKGGDALRGKAYWLVVTTGGPAETYSTEGMHGRPFDDYLPQFRQTAALCAMDWQEPLVLHGAHQVDDAALDAHVAQFIERLTMLAAPAPASAPTPVQG